MPTIVFRVCWMNCYNGLNGDKCVGGGQYIGQHGFGGEIFNFRPFRGYMYGYVQPPGRGNFNARKIHIEKLGIIKKAPFIDGVTVVWVARNPDEGGTYVVGWYSAATIYRSWQEPPHGSYRTYNNEPLGHYTIAAEEKCFLLPAARRIFPVPTGKGGIGQANIWYPDDGFEQRLMQIIQNYEP